jgi:hypothetical protein
MTTLDRLRLKVVIACQLGQHSYLINEFQLCLWLFVSLSLRDLSVHILVTGLT